MTLYPYEVNVFKSLSHLLHMSSERSAQNKTPHNIYSLTQYPFFFLPFVNRLKLFKKTKFRKPAPLPSSGNEAPNIVNPLDQLFSSQVPPFLVFLYLKMESEPASDTSCFFRSCGRWTKSKNKTKGAFVSEPFIIVQALLCSLKYCVDI